MGCRLFDILIALILGGCALVTIGMILLSMLEIAVKKFPRKKCDFSRRKRSKKI
jgi:hypothetical protein